MSLRRGLSLFVITLSTLAVGAGLSLVLLTTHLHRATLEMEDGLNGVHLAEELQIDLLRYDRTKDPSERAIIERGLRQKMYNVRQYVNAPDEEASLNDAEQFLEVYFSEARQPGREPNGRALNDTFTALRRFVDINVQQADASLKESERWDEIGDRIGLG